MTNSVTQTTTQGKIMDEIKKELEKINLSVKYKSRRGVMKGAISEMIEGDIFEFGVWRGESIKFLARMLPDRQIYGFDSFIGLPEAWPGREITHGKGHFNMRNKKPKVHDNVELVAGFFDESLPSFFETYNKQISILHVDCDIYSSTVSILKNAHKCISTGTILVFDEFYNYQNFELNEIKAWLEYANENNIDYKYIYHNIKEQVALKIL
jgi:hypothetical protein